MHERKLLNVCCIFAGRRPSVMLAYSHQSRPVRRGMHLPCRCAFLALPQEVLEQVARQLSPRDSCQLGATCRLGHALVREATPQLDLSLYPHQVPCIYNAACTLVAAPCKSFTCHHTCNQDLPL